MLLKGVAFFDICLHVISCDLYNYDCDMFMCALFLCGARVLVLHVAWRQVFALFV